MPVGGRARGGKRGRVTIASVLGIEARERERAQDKSIWMWLIVNQRQDNVNQIVWNKRRLSSRRKGEDNDDWKTEATRCGCDEWVTHPHYPTLIITINL